MYYVEETGVDILVLNAAMSSSDHMNMILMCYAAGESSHRVVLRTAVKS